MIVEQTYNLLISRYKERFADLTISDVKIGIYLTAVRLSDSSIGTSATLPEDQPLCAKHNRDFGDFTPLKIRGQNVSDILETNKESGTIISLKMAVLNAISSEFLSKGKYKIIENRDPIEL